MRQFKLIRTLLGADITAQVLQLDHDLQVALFGGTCPHIGAVSIVSPAGEVTTQQFPTHKDGVVSERWAKALADAGYCPAVVTVGIHYDDLSRDGIAAVVELTDRMLDEVLALLSGADNVRSESMDTLNAIMTRRSVRAYSSKRISDADLDAILRAGMSGPSCVNARDWAFLVIRDKEMLQKAAEANGKPAEPLKSADVGILVCGDLSRAFPPAKDYWVIDGAISAQNMILAAHSLGIGSVWLGTWPQMDRVQNQARLFDLPDNIVPHSIIAFGYPAESEVDDTEKVREPEHDRVHYDKW